MTEIADIVDDLRDRFESVLVEELTQNHDDESSDPVLVDRDLLTTRQREIIETAHQMGYFDYPKARTRRTSPRNWGSLGRRSPSIWPPPRRSCSTH